MTAAAGDPRILLFLGDASVVDPMVHAAVREKLGGDSLAVDFETFRFGEHPIAGIEASLRQVGMFSPHRCIWLRGFVESRRSAAASPSRAGKEDEDQDDEIDEGADEGDADNAAELLELVEHGVPAGATLVVTAATLDARGRLYKWFAKNADVRDRRMKLEFKGARRGRLSESDLRRAAQGKLQELGVARIEGGALDEIVRRSGNLVGEMLQEIQRVVLAQADPSQLSAAGVRSSMRDLSVGWVFDLTEAVGKRDLAAAEQLIARLLSEGEPPIKLVALLAVHIAGLVTARPIVDRLPRGALRMRGDEFLAGPGASLPEPLRGWPGYFRLLAASRFHQDELLRLHGEVRRLDAALKSSSIDPLLLFSRLLQGACIAGACAPRAV